MAALHATEQDMRPLGSGVLIDERRVLTCAHVVQTVWERSGVLWAAFPKAEEAVDHRVQVADVVLPPGGVHEVRDAAVLHLAEELPKDLAARLRRAAPGDLVGTEWWSFGFPEGVLGNSASGDVGETLGHGWMRLDAHRSRYPVKGGYSGSAVWSAAYEAVVGLIGQAHSGTGDALAITVRQIDRLLPAEKLRELTEWSLEAADEPALSAWGWSLNTDLEAGRHWRPRARGVNTDAERGFRFQGRTAVLGEISRWISAAPPQRKVLVVTGTPGSGKSAVLGRVITTADPDIASSLPPYDTALRAPLGAVACAVHAKGKTALEVAQEIARAASTALPSQVIDLPPFLREVLQERPARSFALVIDALDEAASPADARAIINHILVPLAETCTGAGARLVVGTRRRDDAGDLLASFGHSARVLDLNGPELSEHSDLVAYALATLQLRGDERGRNPYADGALAFPVAERIAELADGNFLVAGLVARAHGMHDPEAVDLDEVSFPVTVETSLREYLRYLPDLAGLSAEKLLIPLAHAESPGLPPRLWRTALTALFRTAPAEDELLAFARSSAANFLLESTTDDSPDISFRLFHQALNDALRASRADLALLASDELAIARAFIEEGVERGWVNAPRYLLRSLATHAKRGGMIDRLLQEDEYLLHADLRRLIPQARSAVTGSGRQRAELLRRTPRALDATASERAALFSVTEVQEDLGTTYRHSDKAAPYQALWSTAPPLLEVAVFEGHNKQVNALCSMRTAERSLVASADEQSIRLWDAVTGEAVRSLGGYSSWVGALCGVVVDDSTLLAGAGSDGTVRLWDPETGVVVREMKGHDAPIDHLCVVDMASHPCLVSAGRDGRLTIWDPRTGEARRTFRTRGSRINSVCAFDENERPLLAISVAQRSKKYDQIRVWDPATGKTVRVFSACSSSLFSRKLTAVPCLDGPLLATNHGEDILLLDPCSGKPIRLLDGMEESDIFTLATVHSAHGPLVVAGYGQEEAGTIVIWDPVTGVRTHSLEGHDGWVGDVCGVRSEGEWLLASAGEDRTVRLWDLDRQPVAQRYDEAGGWVDSLCTLRLGDREALADNGLPGAVRIHDIATGELVKVVGAPYARVLDLCMVQVDDRSCLAIASGSLKEGALQVWDPVSEAVKEIKIEGWPRKISPINVSGRTCLALAFSEENANRVLILDPSSGERINCFDGGDLGRVDDLCGLRTGGGAGLGVLQSNVMDDFGTVTVWDVGQSKVIFSLRIPDAEMGCLCALDTGGKDLLVVKRQVSTDEEDSWGVGSVWVLDPETGHRVNARELHNGWVNSVSRVEFGSRELLASAGQTGRCVGLWADENLRPVLNIPVRREAFSVIEADGRLAVGLSQGVMVLRLHVEQY
ncbi:trypsin-like peptidase domain-containing protein [Streptomyces sp. SUK 48]|uniref:trypsin-like peptidase domain-containing protein n=1 Tax=Streptomyces sp. SUK 48 TaxID=2582831 RepID=UPI0018911B92|nr:trypsin-like peptidase domain-containing protein [Streptomyces sp. SUK 48]